MPSSLPVAPLLLLDADDRAAGLAEVVRRLEEPIIVGREAVGWPSGPLPRRFCSSKPLDGVLLHLLGLDLRCEG